MKETEVIKRAARLVQASTEFHALIVEGPAGWAKSTTIAQALKEAGLDFAHLGSYSTPLSFYNFLFENSTSAVVLDDTAGLLGSELSMAILKSATWSGDNEKRIIRWNSSTAKAVIDEFEFRGKIIIVCNRFPHTPDAMAVKSRSVKHKMALTVDRAKALLTEAADDQERFPDSRAARKAAEYLCGILNEDTLCEISYRTLKLAYEVIVDSPEDWQIMISHLIGPANADPVKLIKKLSKELPSVKKQEEVFLKETGFKRRTFYKYRKELNLSRKYDRG